MGLVGSLDFRDSFADQRVRDDKFRPAVIVLLGVVQRVEESLHIVAVDFLDVEPISLKTRARIFALSVLRGRVERDRVAVVNQNQIIETEVSREGTRFRAHAFLQATVSGKTNT